LPRRSERGRLGGPSKSIIWKSLPTTSTFPRR
jgi:hypothetical protein